MPTAALMLDGRDRGLYSVEYSEVDGKATIVVTLPHDEDLEFWTRWKKRTPTDPVYENFQYRICRLTPEGEETRVIIDTELLFLAEGVATLRGTPAYRYKYPSPPLPDPSNGRDSPCVAICSTLYDDICRGCGRTAMEVAEWVFLDQEEKRRVWVRITAEGYPTRKI